MGEYQSILVHHELGIALIDDLETLQEDIIDPTSYDKVALLGDQLTLTRSSELNDKCKIVVPGSLDCVTEEKHDTYQYWNNSLFWSDRNVDFKKKIITYNIGRNNKVIGVRKEIVEEEQLNLTNEAKFFVHNNTLYDYGPYGVHETVSNKQISRKHIDEIVPDGNTLYIANDGNVFVRTHVENKGFALRIPKDGPELYPFALCPINESLYFLSYNEITIWDWDMPTEKTAVGLFKYYFPTQELCILDEKRRWIPWQPDEFETYPYYTEDYIDAEIFPITKKLTTKVLELEEKFPAQEEFEGSLDDLIE